MRLETGYKGFMLKLKINHYAPANIPKTRQPITIHKTRGSFLRLATTTIALEAIAFTGHGVAPSVGLAGLRF